MTEAFIEYSDYKSEYKGILIPKDSFDSFAMKASSIVNYYTFDKIDKENIEDYVLIKVIFATCEIAELLYEQNQLKENQNDDKSTVASETVGPRSVSYVNKSNLQSQRILSKKELDKETYSICLKHLSRTGLMYRGI
ncbi:MAG: hypothetical protein ACI4VH_07585 [Clostridia bacterium]